MILGMQASPSLRRRALAVLALANPAHKAAEALALHQAVEAGEAPLGADEALATEDNLPPLPGRPARPALVPAHQVPTRSPFTLAGRAALLHAICHIEFNAIKIEFNEDFVSDIQATCPLG